MYVERSPLSAAHLAQGASTPHHEGPFTPHAYTPRDVVLAQLAGTPYLLADSVDRPELLVDLVTFGDEEV